MVCLQVRRIKGLRCDKDPAWSLQLLQAAAASLEELQLNCPRPEHLLVAYNAPRLLRLDFNGDFDEKCLTVDGQPLVLPPLSTPSSLQWLRVYCKPWATLQSLLRAHAASLRTLVLYVGKLGHQDLRYSCRNLHALLGDCGLVALTKLQLVRVGHHQKSGCNQQTQAIRRVLPRATVQCDECEEFGIEEF